MRIVAGKYGGRRLDVPKNRGIRPTGDKVRGAIFNALEARNAVQGARVLDCFCGTGALGLEALSRGADFCSFWDKDKESLGLARANAEGLGAVGQCGFELRDARRVIEVKNSKPYTLLFLDPPYRNNLITPVLQGLCEKEYIGCGGYCVLEMEKDYEPILNGPFEVQFEKTYGESKVFIASYSG